MLCKWKIKSFPFSRCSLLHAPNFIDESRRIEKKNPGFRNAIVDLGLSSLGYQLKILCILPSAAISPIQSFSRVGYGRWRLEIEQLVKAWCALESLLKAPPSPLWSAASYGTRRPNDGRLHRGWTIFLKDILVTILWHCVLRTCYIVDPHSRCFFAHSFWKQQDYGHVPAVFLLIVAPE